MPFRQYTPPEHEGKQSRPLNLKEKEIPSTAPASFPKAFTVEKPPPSMTSPPVSLVTVSLHLLLGDDGGGGVKIAFAAVLEMLTSGGASLPVSIYGQRRGGFN